MYFAILSRTQVINENKTQLNNLNAKVNLSESDEVFLYALGNVQAEPDEAISNWTLANELKRIGYGQIAINVLIHIALENKFIEISRKVDYNGDDYTCYIFTQIGKNWLVDDYSEVKAIERLQPISKGKDSDDDLPF